MAANSHYLTPVAKGGTVLPPVSSVISTRFEQVVRKTLLDNKVAGRKPDSIRSLARTMAKGDQVRAETFKRSLFKWMAAGEPNPSPESRALVADALGVAREALADDDEEADPAMREAFSLFVDLMGRLQTQTTRPELRA